MHHTQFKNNRPFSFQEKVKNVQLVDPTHVDGQRPFVIGHLSDSGDPIKVLIKG